MKKRIILILFFFSLTILSIDLVQAQCSICTRTAEQLGEKPAKGLNAGILYLALTPFVVMGFIGYRWWRNNRD
ncbi:MAG: hypothetical protein ICV79_18735 [Flavisolibacter sp.]|nr:hypothetical protein [Flavisolibacter sp.]